MCRFSFSLLRFLTQVQEICTDALVTLWASLDSILPQHVLLCVFAICEFYILKMYHPELCNLFQSNEGLHFILSGKLSAYGEVYLARSTLSMFQGGFLDNLTSQNIPPPFL